MRIIPSGFILASAVFAAGVVMPGIALGQACAPAADVRARLSETYGETRVWQGVNARGNVTELWLSQSGSWSYVVTTPQGQSCIVDSGVEWGMAQHEPDPGIES